jgi:hypothetical protein
VSALQDIWLPEVEAEFSELLSLNRDVGVDVGNQFRAFEHLLKRGVDSAWRPVDYVGSAALYVMFARHAMMFFAVHRHQAAVVKWTTVGTEHEQRLALAEAKKRVLQAFP